MFTKKTKSIFSTSFSSSFLALCDYMTIAFLHELFGDAFHKMADLFGVHDACKPTAEQLENLAIDVQVESDRPPDVPQNPLFFTTLVLKPTGFEVDPSK